MAIRKKDILIKQKLRLSSVHTHTHINYKQIFLTQKEKFFVFILCTHFVNDRI